MNSLLRVGEHSWAVGAHRTNEISVLWCDVTTSTAHQLATTTINRGHDHFLPPSRCIDRLADGLPEQHKHKAMDSRDRYSLLVGVLGLGASGSTIT
ncbi:hypothetical protein B296_00047682 [Ensete ventricosum]|uniref:Uncharacterized protein n=1 Tax=Ensete ventricosum TaxID=4639 RepID=A0A426YKU9_ENSVE|nr:hypothetical protein B296_00047682 [Ensete ventricosum]